MGGRKQKFREAKSGIYIIGEGITEQYYFLHVKKLFGFRCTIKPRFFGNTSIAGMKTKIEELLRGDIFVICVFDLDVSMHNESERRKLELLQNKYRKNKNLLFCNSFPSIEYWFLLHHENTNRHFKDSKAVETALRKYINNYEKTAQFLEKEKWVYNLCAENKLKQAVERAKITTDKGKSWSNIWKAIEILEENKYHPGV
jgi:hypothetical protein